MITILTFSDAFKIEKRHLQAISIYGNVGDIQI